MKQALYIILIGTALFVSFLIGSYRSPLNQRQQDPRDTSIQNSLDSINVYWQDSLARVSVITDSLLAITRTESFTRVIERFETVYGKPDTIYQPRYVIDSSQLVACNECAIRLDSARISIGVKDKQLKSCLETSHTLIVQREECRDENEDLRELYNLKWYRFLKKHRLKKKLNL